MSYEILYGRQFIDLQNGTYIPMILSGSNNCTMFRNGREVRERHWWPYLSRPALTLDEMRKHANEVALAHPDSEWFMRGGKWMFTSDIPHWIESGIKSARTIEELASHSYPLQCRVIIYDNTIPYGNKGYCREEVCEYIKTTEGLIEWIRRYEEIKKSARGTEAIYPMMSFMTFESLNLGAKLKPGSPVVCKRGNQYLSHYDIGRGYTFSSDADEAIVFESEEDFQLKLAGHRIDKYRLVAPPKPKKDKPIAIQIAGGSYAGYYIEKLTRSRLHFTGHQKYARRFSTEKEAQRFIDEKLKDRFRACYGYNIIKVEAEEEAG